MGADLGKPLLGVAPEPVGSGVIEHVPKRAMIRDKMLEAVWILQLQGVLAGGGAKTSDKSMCS